MRKERLSRVRLVDKRFFKVLIVGILLVLAFPQSIFAWVGDDGHIYTTCTLTIRSDIHTEENPAIPDGLCVGRVLGYYMPHLDEFALRGGANYNLKENRDGQVFDIALPVVQGYSRALLTVYTIKVEPPKQEEPKQPPKDEKPTDPPKQENPKEEPKQPQQPPKDEKPKTEQPKNEPPKNQNPKNEQPKNEQPKTEQPKTENPKTQKPNSEQTKNQNSKTDSKGQNTDNERNENTESESNDSDDGTTETETNESENNESNNGNNGLKEESVSSNKDKNIDQDQIKKDIELSMEPESDKDGSKKSSVWLWLGIINAVVIVGIIGYWWHKKNAY